MYYSRSGRNRSFYTPRRKRRNNWGPKAVFWGTVLLISWIVLKWFFGLFSDIRSEDAFAELTILNGQVEFSLDGTDAWAPAYSDQQFLAGDTLRTNSHSRVSLEILGNNFVFLDANTTLHFEEMEETSSGRKIVLLSLEKGHLWSRVSDDVFGQKKSRFEISTPRSRVHVRGTVFDFSTSDTEDLLRLTKGSVEVELLEEEETPFASVSVGQKIVINAETIPQIKQGRNVLDIIDNNFLESEWHLGNLERFAPQEVADIRRRIELKAARSPRSEKTENAPTHSSHPQPEILTPKPGDRIPASSDSVKVEGVAPEGTLQMVVNGYTLTRFQPGDRKWVYFSSQKFGTLVPGDNLYSVVAVSYDGLRSEPSTVNVFYEGSNENISSKPVEVTSVGTIDSEEFSAPVVTKPLILSDGTAYQTSSEVVTIRGLVDPKTNRIDVNGFKLKRFQPGQTEFSYIANAKYGNMEEGENLYEIKAFGPDDKAAITTVKVVYTPLNVGE